MFAKLSLLILTIGAVAATLLAARQQRLYAVHETAQAMRRIVEHDRTLWRLRGEIGGRVTPNKVKKMADRFGPMAYFYSERSDIPEAPEVALHEGNHDVIVAPEDTRSSPRIPESAPEREPIEEGAGE